MEQKAIIMDESAVKRSLTRISHEIIEKNKGAQDLLLLGVLRRGAPLAKALADNISKIENTKVQYADIDITFYRDDLSKIDETPVLNKRTSLDVADKTVVLVDDVIFTGRTARAAIDAVFEQGRPKQIQLAVLIDRGHRDLPLRPDYVGKNVPTRLSENIRVFVPEYDGKTEVALFE